MRPRRERNAALYADRLAGLSWTQLSTQYGLGVSTVRAIYERERQRQVFGRTPPTREEQSRTQRIVWQRLPASQREALRQLSIATGAAKWRARWAAMTPEQRADRIQRLCAGARRYQAERRFKKRQAAKMNCAQDRAS